MTPSHDPFFGGVSDLIRELKEENERLRAELAAEREKFHDAVLGHSAETLKLTAELAAERKKTARMRVYATAPLKLEAVTAERDAMRALLQEARETLAFIHLETESLIPELARVFVEQIARIDALLEKIKGGGDE